MNSIGELFSLDPPKISDQEIEIIKYYRSKTRKSYFNREKLRGEKPKALDEETLKDLEGFYERVSV
jgi:hypothetical protein